MARWIWDEPAIVGSNNRVRKPVPVMVRRRVPVRPVYIYRNMPAVRQRRGRKPNYGKQAKMVYRGGKMAYRGTKKFYSTAKPVAQKAAKSAYSTAKTLWWKFGPKKKSKVGYKR